MQNMQKLFCYDYVTNSRNFLQIKNGFARMHHEQKRMSTQAARYRYGYG